jgi:glycosyltransferase involved in cell wall biosynthesis
MLRGDTVIANSQWTAQHILSAYRFRPRQLVVIPRGIDLSEFNPAKIDALQVQRQREQWGAGTDHRVTLLPGRLTRWKGQGVFIDALAQLPGNLRENVRAVIAGDAQGRHEYLRELQEAIKRQGMQDFVSIAPHVSNMPLAYAAADIVVSASTDPEAFGRIPPEAGAMGRPVIATDHGGARETILPGVSGLLTPPGDASALAAALADLLTRSQLELKEMGRKGSAHVVQNYSLERMQNETLKLYRTVLDRSVAHEQAAD